MTDKDLLRATIRAHRAAMSGVDRDAARLAIRRAVLTQCRVLGLRPAATVAAYEPLRTEPGSTELLADLATAGYRVIVPVTLPDRDLDWRSWPSPRASGSALIGPADAAAPTDRLPDRLIGPESIARADLILTPAFAVDRAGTRLGRGGGSYDRALARVKPGTVIAALLYSGEVLDQVPADDWDQPVTAVVTPAGWQDLTPTGRGNS